MGCGTSTKRCARSCALDLRRDVGDLLERPQPTLGNQRPHDDRGNADQRDGERARDQCPPVEAAEPLERTPQHDRSEALVLVLDRHDVDAHAVLRASDGGQPRRSARRTGNDVRHLRHVGRDGGAVVRVDHAVELQPEDLAELAAIRLFERDAMTAIFHDAERGGGGCRELLIERHLLHLAQQHQRARRERAQSDQQRGGERQRQPPAQRARINDRADQSGSPRAAPCG